MYIKPSDEFFVLGDKHPRTVSPSTSFPGLQVCRGPWERGCFLFFYTRKSLSAYGKCQVALWSVEQSY